MSRLTLDDVLERVSGVTENGDGYKAHCPAHDDNVQSLSVSEGEDGKLLLNCFAGCEFDDILTALRKQDAPRPKKKKDKKRRVYNYTDRAGKVIYRVVRHPGKEFRAEHPDPKTGEFLPGLGKIKPVLYALSKIQGHEEVYFVEGEKDAKNLWKRGLAATTSPFGAGSWKDTYVNQLKEAGVKRVFALRDNDEPGRAYREAVAKSLRKRGIAVKLIELPGLAAKEDVSDWLNQGHGVDELRKIVEETPWATLEDLYERPSSR